MGENAIKFRLNSPMIEEFPESDFEYTAHIGTDGNTTITWIEDEEKQETDYVTTEVEEYFKNGTWLKA